MLLFSLEELLSYEACYDWFLELFHSDGLNCNRCSKPLPSTQRPHKYSSTGLPSYRCRNCGRVFNLFTETIFQGAHYSCIQLVLLLRGIAQGKTTLHLSKELELNYKNLLDWRHVLQEFLFENQSIERLLDPIVESDEVFINAGEKGEAHLNPEDPPRKRANQKKGSGLI